MANENEKTTNPSTRAWRVTDQNGVHHHCDGCRTALHLIAAHRGVTVALETNAGFYACATCDAAMTVAEAEPLPVIIPTTPPFAPADRPAMVELTILPPGTPACDTCAAPATWRGATTGEHACDAHGPTAPINLVQPGGLAKQQWTHLSTNVTMWPEEAKLLQDMGPDADQPWRPATMTPREIVALAHMTPERFAEVIRDSVAEELAAEVAASEANAVTRGLPTRAELAAEVAAQAHVRPLDQPAVPGYTHSGHRLDWDGGDDTIWPVGYCAVVGADGRPCGARAGYEMGGKGGAYRVGDCAHWTAEGFSAREESRLADAFAKRHGIEPDDVLQISETAHTAAMVRRYVPLRDEWLGQLALTYEAPAPAPTPWTALQDHGYVRAGEMHRLMREHLERHFTLRVDAEHDGDEADVYDADSPGFWAWDDDQVPTDDAQRPMRLESREGGE